MIGQYQVKIKKNSKLNDISRIVASGVMSIIISFIIFFMLQTFFAQILVDYVIYQISSNSYVIILIILMVGLTIFMSISIIISILIASQIKRTSVLKSSFFAFFLNIVVWFSISFLSLYYYYPNIFNNIRGWQLLIIFPELIMYFSIYILNNVTYIWFYMDISYGIIFMIFLYIFNIKKEKIKMIEKERNYKW